MCRKSIPSETLSVYDTEDALSYVAYSKVGKRAALLTVERTGIV